MATALAGKLCKNKWTCDRTGLPHEPWDPVVQGGRILSYPTAAEEGYPIGMRKAIAEVIAAEATATDMDLLELDFIFSEVFSGPSAELTQAVHEQVLRSRGSSAA